MKKILSSVIALTMTFTLTTSAFALPDETNIKPIDNQVQSTTVDIYTDNDVPLGKMTTTLVYEREQKGDSVEVTITTNKHYELNEGFQNDPVYTDFFNDSSSTTTIEVTDEKEYFVDGEKLSDAELNQSFNGFEKRMAYANDSGGVPKLGHYYSSGGTTNYYFATYSGMTMGGDADGSHVSKYTTRTNSYFSQAANTLDILYGDHQSYLWAKVQISAAVVAFPFTLASVIGAIADGGAIAISAAQLYSAYKDCNSDLSKAYNLVSQM
ncbi:hypothetical protein [Paenibacillus alvei]|uniref:hypothetical protein n=1 Tax=Paenibacillus alvei TaxID=44250 RepID=UPI002282AF11|nr:hypothetical protein [Paenibacillus alvei]MCY7484235.1 hypothetical protein [Paenibacillus alvei]